MDTGKWSESFSELKRHHDEAFHVIETALKLEEEGKSNEAIMKYNYGLACLDKALSVTIESPPNPDVTWEKACGMIQKMKKTRKEVIFRISKTHSSLDLVPPPTYEEATSASNTPNQSGPQTYSELAAALQNLKVDIHAQTATILYSQDNVCLYFIFPDGTVASTLEQQTLNIAQLEEGDDAKHKIYLQIGDWIYPLIPGVSPCYQTDYGTFLLPDVHSTVEGSAVGITLPEEADPSIYELLDEILCGAVRQQVVSQARSRRQRREIGISHYVAEGLVKGAHYLSSDLVRGAEKAGEFMTAATPRLMSKLTPSDSPAPVNPVVSNSLRVAKNVTGTAVQVTGFIASQIGCATMALGRYLAPHVQKHGTRLLSRTWNMSENEASEKVSGVFEVAAGAAEGFGTLYHGLETSASILASNLANNTVKVVQHKYGSHMGEVADDTFHTVGNVFRAQNTARFLTPKGLIKTTVKGTGRGILADYKAAVQDNENFSQQSGQQMAARQFGIAPSSEID